jgi:hypothetical protein
MCHCFAVGKGSDFRILAQMPDQGSLFNPRI